MSTHLTHLKNLNTQDEKQLHLLRRSRIDPASVSYEQWLDAIAGTDGERDVLTASYVEMERRRSRGEYVDGWVSGVGMVEDRAWSWQEFYFPRPILIFHLG